MLRADELQERDGYVSFEKNVVKAQEFVEPSGVMALGLQDEYPNVADVPSNVAFRILPGGLAVADVFDELDKTGLTQIDGSYYPISVSAYTNPNKTPTPKIYLEYPDGYEFPATPSLVVENASDYQGNVTAYFRFTELYKTCNAENFPGELWEWMSSPLSQAPTTLYFFPFKMEFYVEQEEKEPSDIVELENDSIICPKPILEFNGSNEISISCEHQLDLENSGVSLVALYTTDGSEPNKDSLYSTDLKITITESCTLKVKLAACIFTGMEDPPYGVILMPSETTTLEVSVPDTTSNRVGTARVGFAVL